MVPGTDGAVLTPHFLSLSLTACSSSHLIRVYVWCDRGWATSGNKYVSGVFLFPISFSFLFIL
ncbi:hypothetical protein F4810DRAFT_70613 [Camillea tinctor]|nr:hypothetical protein F4810DRAFT_70613 [Camillea tinctor]